MKTHLPFCVSRSETEVPRTCGPLLVRMDQVPALVSHSEGWCYRNVNEDIVAARRSG